MSKKQIIGLVIFLVLILIIVGIKFIGDKKDSVSGKRSNNSICSNRWRKRRIYCK